MKKPVCVVYSQYETASGYGARSRGFLKELINLKGDEWDLKFYSSKWGSTPMNFIEENPDWGFLDKYKIKTLPKPNPDIFIMISVPQEMIKYGKYNILITAGIESTIASHEFIEGCNRADLVLVSSNHSKQVFENSQYKAKDKKSGETIDLKLNTSIEVLFEEADTSIFNPRNFDGEFKNLDVPENFNYLFVGNWLAGDFPYDRKGIGLLIYNFYDTFRDKPNQPGLILKTSLAGVSNFDRYHILKKINEVKTFYKRDNPTAKKLPNVYLIHGLVTDNDLASLYNNPKIKAMVSLTRGEGFGRPLLEFSMTGKPIITSKWSGQLDFLSSKYNPLIPGDLINIHPSASNKMLLKEAKWFNPNTDIFKKELLSLHKKYPQYLKLSKEQGNINRKNFSQHSLRENMKKIFDKHIITTMPFTL